jgi:oligoribonuclease NrnB/cAMP/cGMP phosphodiesterase (DHH superfamily)
MKTLIIAHNDLDGLFSAAGYIYCESGIIDNPLKKTEDLLINYDLVILGINNTDFFKKLDVLGYDINNYQKLVMVDYSLDLKSMKKLKDLFNDDFIWIDHHESVYKEIEQNLNINGLRDVNHSAATLVFKYFNKEPALVSKYVEDIDIWKFNLENTEEILSAISTILKSTIKGPIIDFNLINLDYVFLYLDDDYFLEQKDSLIEKGKIINNHEKDDARIALADAGIYMFEGYKTIIINSSLKASIFSLIIFNSEKYKTIEQILVWSKSYKTQEYKFSIRSREHDCNIIAKKYGGNGHKQASGFKIDDLKIIEDNLKNT